MQQQANKENVALNSSGKYSSVAELLDTSERLNPKRLKQKMLTSAKKPPCKKPHDTPKSQDKCNCSCDSDGVHGSKVTIKDLCPEEKQKIGDLMRKLAQEKQEKEQMQRQFDREKKELRDSIQKLSQNHQVSSEIKE